MSVNAKSYLILFISIFFLSCSPPRQCPELTFDPIERLTTNKNGDLFTGRCMTKIGDQKRSVQRYVNGIDYGKWVFYLPSGKIETIGRFNENGLRVGTWRYYHKSGKIKQIAKYKRDGERKGIWKWYDLDGKLIKKTSY